MATAPWTVERASGRAGDLLSFAAGDGPGRRVRVVSVDSAALVLGSTQRGSVTAPPGVEVVRRRSGGGAVLVEPGRIVWVDVVVPRGDGLWDDDVARAFWWLGETWARALAAVGVTGAAVHRGGLCTTQWSRSVCFAGLGTGEVTLGERKVVGLAQRRTRTGALFQCAVPLAWDPGALAEALGLPASATSDLADVVAPVTGVVAGVLERAFVAALP